MLCFIERGNSVFIIDPGDNAELISSNISSDKRVLGIIITHSHDDHTGASLDLLNKYKTRLFHLVLAILSWYN